MDLEPKVVAMTDDGDDKQYGDMKRRFWVGVALSVPLLVIAMGLMVGLRLTDLDSYPRGGTSCRCQLQDLKGHDHTY